MYLIITMHLDALNVFHRIVLVCTIISYWLCTVYLNFAELLLTVNMLGTSKYLFLLPWICAHFFGDRRRPWYLNVFEKNEVTFGGHNDQVVDIHLVFTNTCWGFVIIVASKANFLDDIPGTASSFIFTILGRAFSYCHARNL